MQWRIYFVFSQYARVSTVGHQILIAVQTISQQLQAPLVS